MLAGHPRLLGRRARLVLPLIYGAFCVLTADQKRRAYFGQFFIRDFSLGKLLIASALGLIVLIMYLAVFRRRRLLSGVLIVTMLFCGATVNPLEQGSGAVTNHPISAIVSRIAEEEPESCWLCTDSVFLLSSFLLANGARVLDATNFYPDAEKWALIDPAGQYEEMTNRYANQCAELTERETSVELLNADYIKLCLNPDTLRTLDIRYLFGPIDHTELLARYGISCEYVAGQDGYGIYRLSYDS